MVEENIKTICNKHSVSFWNCMNKSQLPSFTACEIHVINLFNCIRKHSKK
jgi:hypothetical protein